MENGKENGDDDFVPLYIDNLVVVEGACYSTKSFTPSIIHSQIIQKRILLY